MNIHKVKDKLKNYRYPNTSSLFCCNSMKIRKKIILFGFLLALEKAGCEKFIKRKFWVQKKSSRT